MTITEVIKELEKVKNSYGDIDCNITLRELSVSNNVVSFKSKEILPIPRRRISIGG